MIVSLLLKNANLFVPCSLGPGSVLIKDGRIVSVHRIGDTEPDVPSIDLGGAVLGPGLIDVHTHGADGVDLMDGGDAASRMARFFVRHGVTGFVPATATASFAALKVAVEGVRRAMDAPAGGARVLGVHLEGPFVSAQRLGAQSPDFCIAPTESNVEHLLDIAGNVARIVTLAPEVEGADRAIRHLVERGIVVSIGHTVATAAQTQAAFAAGASQVTHTFNGMPPLHHRRPGAIGAALTTPGVCIELIADGVHLAPTTIRLALAAKGVDDVLLVTDSMAATGRPDGQYALGPVQVVVCEGQARLPSGALAGSTLTMERAVTHVARWTSAGLSGAWQMASLNPARQLGIDDRVGRVVPGYAADLTAIDARGRVVLTMIDGEIVYQGL